MSRFQQRNSLLSERAALLSLLERTSANSVITRKSLESRLKSIESLIATIPSAARPPANMLLTFRGRPVVGSYGVFADFGSKAVTWFDKIIAMQCASYVRPVNSMGPIPDRDLGRLLITGTATGSFGFNLEEHVNEESSEAGLFEDDGLVKTAMAATQRLFESTQEEDEKLAEAVAGLERRVLNNAREFLEYLSANDAVCAIEHAGKRFAFKDVSEVRRAVDRLKEENIHERAVSLHGQFQGVLPKRRTFEFLLSQDSQVIGGKIGPGVSDPHALNDLLDKPMTVTFTEIIAGSGRPRYALNVTPT